ncbi:MAG: branched-chain-amino-acid transaminase [Alphaproteobacteria bacterium]|nr:branched-chain-amino-acid transaminase [Alphaproteobacteria bacterium]
MIGEWVYVNGEFAKKDEAKVSVFDHAFVYGDGIFEGLQAVNGGVFKLDRHIERFYRSARYMEITMPLSPEAMTAAILETARRNGLRDGYMRPMVSRGVGPMGIRNMAQLSAATVVIVAQHERIEDRKAAFEKGIRAHIASIRRVPSECLDSRVKSANYINNIMAYLEAKHAGYDTAILLDMQGNVAEGYGNNVFAVDGGALLTPPVGNILAGITREAVMELAKGMNLPTEVRPMTVYDLVTAEEVFDSASMSELTPIVDVDGRRIGDGRPGPVTKRLHRALRELMESGRQSAAIFNA